MTSTTSGQINVNAPAYVKNERLIEWVGEVAALTKPDAIRWCDGSQAEYDELCELLVKAGVFTFGRVKTLKYTSRNQQLAQLIVLSL